MKILWSVYQYILYYLRADTIYNIHSPLVSDLMSILLKKPVHDDFSKLLIARDNFLESNQSIDYVEFGAGSRKIDTSKKVKLRHLAATSLSSNKQCVQLYNLCRWLQPQTVLELGTSFGLSSAYLQLAHSEARVISIEGNSSLVMRAQNLHEQVFDGRRPEVIEGRFSDVLKSLLPNLQQIDLLFLDGDHTYESTISYLERIKPKLAQDSIVILHDIYWSKEMSLAWEYAREMGPAITIDLFHMGILLFQRNIRSRENLTIIPYWKKPWKIGLFA